MKCGGMIYVYQVIPPLMYRSGYEAWPWWCAEEEEQVGEECRLIPDGTPG